MAFDGQYLDSVNCLKYIVYVGSSISLSFFFIAAYEIETPYHGALAMVWEMCVDLYDVIVHCLWFYRWQQVLDSAGYFK